VNRKLVVVGDGAFAEIAFEYFNEDTEYSVAAFAVEREFISKKELFGVPVVPFEEIENSHPPSDHDMFVALTYAGLNRVRTRLFLEAKEKGYKLATYVSPRAFVWKNVPIGVNCFIFEGNVIQPFAEISDNCILWSGTIIAHHSKIGVNCFISSQVAVAGYVEVGENCFLGINSTIADNVKIARDNVIGAGARILSDTEENAVYKGTPAAKGTRRGTEIFQPGGGGP
jgi:sugar O-acyltransferase (sialic acid O-acetyltransferase NeuD family)